MESKNPRAVIVGGGPAGMAAGLYASRAGADVRIYERNEKLGKKLYITGKGRCNVTNDAEPEDFMRKINRNPRFLYASLATLNNQKFMGLLENLGVPLKTERGGRVFPASDRASDITRAFERALLSAGVKIAFNARVADIVVRDGRVAGIALEDGTTEPADRVILATGGISYPSTGSDGDGYRMAEALNHAIVMPIPTLTPIETAEGWPKPLTGLSLRNVRLSAEHKGKRFFREEGELLFTHFGVSGPLVLSLSSVLPEDPRGVKMEIDLKFALDDKTLNDRLLRELAAAPNRRLIGIVEKLEPHALALAVIRQAGLSSEIPANAVTREMRQSLRAAIKAMPLTVARLRGFDEAIITRGGVSVKDIMPSTLESRRVPGLFFAGEMIDVDAMTGGYNLQIAFSTGALAGMAAARGN